MIRLTPSRAQALVERLVGVLEEEQEDDGDEAVQYVVQLNGFAYPGKVGQ